MLKAKKLFLLDMDGTIYEGGRLFNCVNEFLSHIEETGGRYIFITNNSSRSVKDYVIKLSNMGVKVTEDNFFTSSQATALYLNDRYKNKKIYLVYLNHILIIKQQQIFVNHMVKNGSIWLTVMEGFIRITTNSVQILLELVVEIRMIRILLVF